MGWDQAHKQDLDRHTIGHGRRNLQVVVGASAQRNGSTGPLNSEREDCHLRVYSIVSTLQRAQVRVGLKSLHWSHLARCENCEKLKLQEMTINWKCGLKEKRNRGQQKHSGLG